MDRYRTKCCRKLRFEPLICESVGFAILACRVHTHKLVWAPPSWFRILYNQNHKSVTQNHRNQVGIRKQGNTTLSTKCVWSCLLGKTYAKATVGHTTEIGGHAKTLPLTKRQSLAESFTMSPCITFPLHSEIQYQSLDQQRDGRHL
jgi:hypothetical protein